MKLTQLIKAWDILHIRDVGEIGFCDFDQAFRDAGVIITIDTDDNQPVVSRPDSAVNELTICPWCKHGQNKVLYCRNCGYKWPLYKQ